MRQDIWPWPNRRAFRGEITIYKGHAWVSTGVHEDEPGVGPGWLDLGDGPETYGAEGRQRLAYAALKARDAK